MEADTLETKRQSNSIKIAYVIHMMQLKGITNKYSTMEELCSHIAHRIRVDTYDCSVVVSTLQNRK